MRKIKAHAVGGFVRAKLTDMRPEHFSEGPVNKVSPGVVPTDRAPAIPINLQSRGGSDGGEGVIRRQFMQVTARFIFHAIDELELSPADHRVTRVADLSAHFSVEGGLVENEVGVFFCLNDIDQLGRRGVG